MDDTFFDSLNLRKNYKPPVRRKSKRIEIKNAESSSEPPLKRRKIGLDELSHTTKNKITMAKEKLTTKSQNTNVKLPKVKQSASDSEIKNVGTLTKIGIQKVERRSELTPQRRSFCYGDKASFILSKSIPKRHSFCYPQNGSFLSKIILDTVEENYSKKPQKNTMKLPEETSCPKKVMAKQTKKLTKGQKDSIKTSDVLPKAKEIKSSVKKTKIKELSVKCKGKINCNATVKITQEREEEKKTVRKARSLCKTPVRSENKNLERSNSKTLKRSQSETCKKTQNKTPKKCENKNPATSESKKAAMNPRKRCESKSPANNKSQTPLKIESETPDSESKKPARNLSKRSQCKTPSLSENKTTPISKSKKPVRNLSKRSESKSPSLSESKTLPESESDAPESESKKPARNLSKRRSQCKTPSLSESKTTTESECKVPVRNLSKWSESRSPSLSESESKSSSLSESQTPPESESQTLESERKTTPESESKTTPQSECKKPVKNLTKKRSESKSPPLSESESPPESESPESESKTSESESEAPESGSKTPESESKTTENESKDPARNLSIWSECKSPAMSESKTPPESESESSESKCKKPAKNPSKRSRRESISPAMSENKTPLESESKKHAMCKSKTPPISESKTLTMSESDKSAKITTTNHIRSPNNNLSRSSSKTLKSTQSKYPIVSSSTTGTTSQYETYLTPTIKRSCKTKRVDSPSSNVEFINTDNKILVNNIQSIYNPIILSLPDKSLHSTKLHPETSVSSIDLNYQNREFYKLSSKENLNSKNIAPVTNHMNNNFENMNIRKEANINSIKKFSVVGSKFCINETNDDCYKQVNSLDAIPFKKVETENLSEAESSNNSNNKTIIENNEKTVSQTSNDNVNEISSKLINLCIPSGKSDEKIVKRIIKNITVSKNDLLKHHYSKNIDLVEIPETKYKDDLQLSFTSESLWSTSRMSNNIKSSLNNYSENSLNSSKQLDVTCNSNKKNDTIKDLSSDKCQKTNHSLSKIELTKSVLECKTTDHSKNVKCRDIISRRRPSIICASKCSSGLSNTSEYTHKKNVTIDSNKRVNTINIKRIDNDKYYVVNQSVSSVVGTESASYFKISENNKRAQYRDVFLRKSRLLIYDPERSSSFNSSGNSRSSSKQSEPTSICSTSENSSNSPKQSKPTSKSVSSIINVTEDQSQTSSSNTSETGSVPNSEIAHCTDLITDNTKINILHNPTCSSSLINSSENSHNSSKKLDLLSDSYKKIDCISSVNTTDNLSISNVVSPSESKYEIFDNNGNSKGTDIISKNISEGNHSSINNSTCPSTIDRSETSVSNSNIKNNCISNLSNDKPHVTNQSLTNVVGTESASKCEIVESNENAISKRNNLLFYDHISSPIISSEDSHNSSKQSVLTSDIINFSTDKSHRNNQPISNEDGTESKAKCDTIIESNENTEIKNVITSSHDSKQNSFLILNPVCSEDDDIFTEENYKSPKFMENVMEEIFSLASNVSENNKSVDLQDGIENYDQRPGVIINDTESQHIPQNADTPYSNSSCISETQNILQHKNDFKINKSSDYLNEIGSELELDILQENLLKELISNDSVCSEINNFIKSEIDIDDNKPSSSGVNDVLSDCKKINGDDNLENEIICDNNNSADSDSWEDFKRRPLHKNIRNQLNDVNEDSCVFLGKNKMLNVDTIDKNIAVQKIDSKKFKLSKFVKSKVSKKKYKKKGSDINIILNENPLLADIDFSSAESTIVDMPMTYALHNHNILNDEKKFFLNNNKKMSAISSDLLTEITLTNDQEKFNKHGNLQNKHSVEVYSLKSIKPNNITLDSDLGDIGYVNEKDQGHPVSAKNKNTNENSVLNSSNNLSTQKIIDNNKKTKILLPKIKESLDDNDENTVGIENLFPKLPNNIVKSTQETSINEEIFNIISNIPEKGIEDPIVENASVEDFNSTFSKDIPYDKSLSNIKDTKNIINSDTSPNCLLLNHSKELNLVIKDIKQDTTLELPNNNVDKVDSCSKNIKSNFKKRFPHKKIIRKRPSSEKYSRLKKYRQKITLLHSNDIYNNTLSQNQEVKNFPCINNNETAFPVQEITDDKILKSTDSMVSSKSLNVKEVVETNANQVEYVANSSTELTNSDFEASEEFIFSNDEGESSPDTSRPSDTTIVQHEKIIPVCKGKNNQNLSENNIELEDNCSVVSSSSITKTYMNTSNNIDRNARDDDGPDDSIARSSHRIEITPYDSKEKPTTNEKQASKSIEVGSTSGESSHEFNIQLSVNRPTNNSGNTNLPDDEIVSEGFLHECLKPYCHVKILTNECQNSNCNKLHEIKERFFDMLAMQHTKTLLKTLVKKASRISTSFLKEVLSYFGLNEAMIPILSLSGRFISKEFSTTSRLCRSYFKEVSVYFFDALNACGLKRADILKELINYNMKFFSSCELETILYILDEWEVHSSLLYPVWPVIEPLILRNDLILSDNILLKMFEEVMEAQDLNLLRCYANQLLLLPPTRFYLFNNDCTQNFILKLNKMGLLLEAERLINKIHESSNFGLPHEQPGREHTPKIRTAKSLPNLESPCKTPDAPPEELLQLGKSAVQIAVKSGNYRQLITTIVSYSEKNIRLNILEFVFNCFNEEEPCMMTELLIKEFSQGSAYAKYIGFCSSLICSFIIYFSKTCLWEVSYGFICLFDKFKLDKYNVKDAIGEISLMRIILVYSEVYFYNRCYKEAVQTIQSKQFLCNFLPRDVEEIDEDTFAAQIFLESLLREYLNMMKVDLAAIIFGLVLDLQHCRLPIDLSQYFEALLILIYNKNEVDERPLKFYIALCKEKDIPLYGLSVRILVNMAYRFKNWSLVSDLFQKGLESCCYPCIEGEEYTIILVKSFTEEEMRLYISEWCLHFKKRLIQGQRTTPKTLTTKDGNIDTPIISISFKDETIKEFKDTANYLIPLLLLKVDESQEGYMSRLKNVVKNFKLEVSSTTNESLIINTISFFNHLEKV